MEFLLRACLGRLEGLGWLDRRWLGFSGGFWVLICLVPRLEWPNEDHSGVSAQGASVGPASSCGKSRMVPPTNGGGLVSAAHPGLDFQVPLLWGGHPQTAKAGATTVWVTLFSKGRGGLLIVQAYRLPLLRKPRGLLSKGRTSYIDLENGSVVHHNLLVKAPARAVLGAGNFHT